MHEPNVLKKEGCSAFEIINSMRAQVKFILDPEQRIDLSGGIRLLQISKNSYNNLYFRLIKLK